MTSWVTNEFYTVQLVRPVGGNARGVRNAAKGDVVVHTLGRRHRAHVAPLAGGEVASARARANPLAK